MPGPNFFRDRKPYNTVKIGGRLVKAALKAIDGHELTDKWNVQEGTNTSGGTAAYRGIALFEGVKLTFACGDGDGSTAEQDLDDLYDLWEIMKPAGPGGGKPPSLVIENAILNRTGLTVVCRKAWREGPTDTGGYEVDLTVIQYAPQAPAGAGAQDPAKKSTGGAGSTVDPQIAALRAQRDALAAEAAAV